MLTCLRVRRRAALLTLESQGPGRPVPHARFGRVTVQYWRLEMATHVGRWDPTQFRGPLDEVFAMRVSDSGQVLYPAENPQRTWGTGYLDLFQVDLSVARASLTEQTTSAPAKLRLRRTGKDAK